MAGVPFPWGQRRATREHTKMTALLSGTGAGGRILREMCPNVPTVRLLEARAFLCADGPHEQSMRQRR